MKELFLSMWDSATRFRYKPDAYIDRVRMATGVLLGVGWPHSKKKVSLIVSEGWTPIDVTDQVAILIEFSEVSMELWKSLNKTNLNSVMVNYSATLRRLEQSRGR